MRKPNFGNVVGVMVLSVLGIALLNKILEDPRISPFWRKIGETAEGDLYQHILNEALILV